MDEFSLELLQPICGLLGRAATHNQAPHVTLLLEYAPLGFSKEPIRAKRFVIVSWGHGRKMRLDA